MQLSTGKRKKEESYLSVVIQAGSQSSAIHSQNRSTDESSPSLILSSETHRAKVRV